jgi:putative two-component system response regulator
MRILLADDNHFYRLALEATLKECGYEVISVADGASALEVLCKDNAPKLAILDWVMPRVDGLEVIRCVRALDRPEPTYIIVLTSKGGKQNIIAALESGADDYLIKPFDREELQARLRVGERIVGLQTSQTVVFTFARAVEAKSPFTQGHADRVTAHALALANALDLSKADKNLLRRGSLLHDIGKISVPDDILNKPGPLTAAEYDIIKQHPSQGVKMVEPLRSLADTIPLIRWHHERLDGRGYPDGLRGEQIPLLVRILSVADVHDAMASTRPYRDAIPHEECLRRLRADAAGGGLDAELVERFCQLFRTVRPGGALPVSVPLAAGAVLPHAM